MGTPLGHICKCTYNVPGLKCSKDYNNTLSNFGKFNNK
jgi:hypothetical protein